MDFKVWMLPFKLSSVNQFLLLYAAVYWTILVTGVPYALLLWAALCVIRCLRTINVAISLRLHLWRGRVNHNCRTFDHDAKSSPIRIIYRHGRWALQMWHDQSTRHTGS